MLSILVSETLRRLPKWFWPVIISTAISMSVGRSPDLAPPPPIGPQGHKIVQQWSGKWADQTTGEIVPNQPRWFTGPGGRRGIWYEGVMYDATNGAVIPGKVTPPPLPSLTGEITGPPTGGATAIFRAVAGPGPIWVA